MTTPSPEQSAFVEQVVETNDSIVLEACAGSGKTTTLIMAVEQLKSSVAACAFNKRIADELAERMPNAVCRTMNSFGHRAWARQIGRRAKLESSKMYTIGNDHDKEAPYEVITAARQLASKAKHFGIVPDGAVQGGHGLVDDTDDAWIELIDTFDIDTNGSEKDVIYWAREFLRVSIEQAWQGIIDFDDQIYMTACWKAPLDRYFTVIVDEAQDISAIQREMIRRMAPRIIAAGDRHQAIYGFRGASFTSLDDFQQQFNSVTMPLTVSFRCPQAVVAEARNYVSHINAHESAPMGSVERAGEFDVRHLKRGCVILCRNNNPIISLAMRLLRDQIGCKVLGRDIGANLKRLCDKFTNKGTNDDIRQLQMELIKYMEREISKYKAAKRPGRAATIEDKVLSLLAIAEHSDTVTALFARLDEMFDDKKGVITLSTIHKAKGFEWDRVLFLDSGLIPSKWAKTESQMQQETNLSYVAVTRAKNELIFIDSPERDSQSEEEN